MIYSVTEVNRMAADVLAATPFLNAIEIKGELSGGKRYPSGHFYFTLKDDNAAIRGVMFNTDYNRLEFSPKDGDKLVLKGSVSIYQKSGSYQIIAKSMQLQGLGNLYIQFENLKRDLEKEGYFSQERKKTIPIMPKAIGLATSEAGAVLHDILTVLRRRFPGFKMDFIPVSVQGQGAAQQIAAAIDKFNVEDRVDVVIIGRGGGSIEDLWAFNEKILADAIFRSKIPIISAVGHETDFTISDFTADLRAATPSAAAELVTIEKSKLYDLISQSQDRMVKAMANQLNTARKSLDFYAKRPVLLYPERLLQAQRQKIDEILSRLYREIDFQLGYHKQEHVNLINRLQAGLRTNYDQARQNYQALAAKLEALDPLAILDRGYSYVQDAKGGLIKSVDQLKVGTDVNLYWRDGQASATIKNLEKRKDKC